MMKSMIVVFVPLSLCSFFTLFLNGCTSLTKKNLSGECRLVARIPAAGIGNEINVLQKEIKSGSPSYAENALKLSFLYSHNDNLKPDYEKAFDMMNDYLKMTPEKERFYLAGYIHSLLGKIKKQSGYLKKNKAFLRDEKKKKSRLMKKNKELEKKISSLMRLDIRLEKQRLGVE